MSELLHQLIRPGPERPPEAPALSYRQQTLSYGGLHDAVVAAARGLIGLGLERGARVCVYLEKRFETVVTQFASAAAGGVFVPVNPLLRARQATHILKDSEASVLVTSVSRLEALAGALPFLGDLRVVVLVDGGSAAAADGMPSRVAWPDLIADGGTGGRPEHRVIDTDMVAILYTSGSTGMPKGVVLSHRNMVAGAKSVSSYLENHRDDVILSLLPLSFDAGFSQLTTAFNVGARVVLMNYLLPRDAVQTCAAEKVTGITGVPPLWIQLAQQDWPSEAVGAMRYFANTGGHMPRSTLDRLRALMPRARPYLMYGLTEAFRSTYLDPSEVDRRPDSIGKAIPNAEILVVGKDGRACSPGVPGELVHRGALVALGYWKDPERTASRFRPSPGQPAGLCLPEIAVWSGDIVRTDEDGFLYFVGRSDEMIKTSGYRVSPTEIEEVVYASGLAGEAAAFGVPHPVLGQGIVVVVAPPNGSKLDINALNSELRQQLPLYMVPGLVAEVPALPRTPNGKIDRKQLASEFATAFDKAKP